MKFVNRNGSLRLYDGTATPYYLQLIFDNGDFTGPIGIAKTDEILVLNRGLMDANAHHIEGGDAKIMEPFDIKFSTIIEDTTITTYLLDLLEGGTVNSNALVSTNGDTQRDGVNDNPLFTDTTKKTFNLEYRLDGSTDIVWHYNECYFDLSKQSMSESEEGITLTLSGGCYGTVVRDAAFTAGADVTA